MLRRGGRRVTRSIADPSAAALRWRGRTRPRSLFARHARLARAAGIDRVLLVLSFDCDTPEDAAVAPALHHRLMELGVTAAYAVPGRLLEEGRDAYREIAATGAEFLNHGFEDHAEWSSDLGRWVSRWFYDTLDEATIRADVERGDRAVRDTVGRAPVGFRAPHFGTFQSPRQLRFLHAELQGLGYTYSSSTVPLYGFREGPAFTRLGVVELPVSGMGSDPLTILDSWGCFAAPDRVHGSEDYLREAVELARALAGAGAGVINCYADPAHVADRPEFLEAVRAWRQVAEPIAPAELAAMVRA
jgi:hypothetical protein